MDQFRLDFSLPDFQFSVSFKLGLLGRFLDPILEVGFPLLPTRLVALLRQF